MGTRKMEQETAEDQSAKQWFERWSAPGWEQSEGKCLCREGPATSQLIHALGP